MHVRKADGAQCRGVSYPRQGLQFTQRERQLAGVIEPIPLSSEQRSCLRHLPKPKVSCR